MNSEGSKEEVCMKFYQISAARRGLLLILVFIIRWKILTRLTKTTNSKSDP